MVLFVKCLKLRLIKLKLILILITQIVDRTKSELTCY